MLITSGSQRVKFLGEGKLLESTEFCPRTQHNDPAILKLRSQIFQCIMKGNVLAYLNMTG